MTDSLPLRIFLATPGDLHAERLVVVRAVEEWNLRRQSHGVQFEVVGWERVRGTARRPQEAINELIGESHFLVVIFKERWGSEPGSSWGYTSGTEEELFQGLLDLGLADQPMRDVWIAFMNTSAPDPMVKGLQNQLIQRHLMLFEQVADLAELKQKFSARLDGWEVIAGTKVARHVELMSSAGSEILRAVRLRVEGEKLVELGQADAGRVNLREAAELGGPEEALAYGRLLARQGDLDGADAATTIAIDKARGGDPGLFSATAAEAFSAQAGLLRRRGDHQGAVGRLEQALTLLNTDAGPARRVRCRILDEIGLAQQAIGDLGRAKEALHQSYELRRSADGTPSEVAQSLINLARLAVKERDLAAARARADKALATLESIPPTALHANAEILAAQVRLRQGDAQAAMTHAERALILNRQFSSANGEAIALLLLTQCQRAMGNQTEALESAQACLAINERIGNARGAAQAKWQLDALQSNE